MSITTKIFVIIVLTCRLAVAVGSIYSTRTSSELAQKSVVARKEFLHKAVDSQISSKMDIGIDQCHRLCRQSRFAESAGCR